MRALILLSVFLLGYSAHSKPLSERQIDVQSAAEYVRNALRQPEPIQDGHGRLVVPSADVAIRIHVAVATAAFGSKPLGLRPFHATRSGAYWVVWGSVPRGMAGGTATTVIRARDGAVMHVFISV
jgi:hypothetical protein